MDLLLLIGWVILGTVLFFVVHKALNITYFGFSGIFSVWFGCMAAIAIGFYFLAALLGSAYYAVVGFVSAHYKWIIGGIVVLGFLSASGNKKEKADANKAQEDNHTN